MNTTGVKDMRQQIKALLLTAKRSVVGLFQPLSLGALGI